MNREENIERYLSEEMNAAERQAFELAMEEDPSLRTEVALYGDLDAFLQNTKRVDVAKKVAIVGDAFFNDFTPNQQEDVVAPPKPSNRSWIWIIGVVVVFLLIWFLFWKLQPTNKIETSESLETPKQPEIIETPIIETKTEKTEEYNTIPIVPTFPKEESTNASKPDQPIAEVDPSVYVPNPILEDLVKQAVRTSTYVLEVETPKNNQRFAYQAKTNIQIRGTIKNFTLNSRSGFDLFIFDNNSEHFANEQNLLQYRLPLKETTNGTYSFSFNANLELSRGLYYFYILDIRTKGLPYTGKFLID